MKKMDVPTICLLRLVGSPFADSDVALVDCDSTRLYRYAIRNKMPLLYLSSLGKTHRNGFMQSEYTRLNSRYKLVETAVHKVSEVLKRTNISCALFKSVRPYQEVGADIDILIFGSYYSESLKAMRRSGYSYLGQGPLSTTFRDENAKINLDIYDEVAVSRIIYLDKCILKGSIVDRELSNGNIVRSLSPEADLLSIIAHSVVKEQIYVLSEYYTTLYYLLEMRSGGLQRFVTLVDRSKMRSAVRAHLGITALLHNQAHSNMPKPLVELIEMFRVDGLELLRVSRMGFAMPHKYRPATIFRVLYEKSAESKARKSYAWQTAQMVRPKSILSMSKQILGHIRRQTY